MKIETENLLIFQSNPEILKIRLKEMKNYLKNTALEYHF
jgi:hypothetical protein